MIAPESMQVLGPVDVVAAGQGMYRQVGRLGPGQGLAVDLVRRPVDLLKDHISGRWGGREAVWPPIPG